MKYLRQFLLVLLLTLAAEILHELIPLPIPASIYGLLLLFALLMTGWLKLPHIQEVGRFLLEIMPVLFVPPAVSLLAYQAEISSLWLPLLLAASVTTIVVFGCTGLTAKVLLSEKSSGKSSGKSSKKSTEQSTEQSSDKQTGKLSEQSSRKEKT